MKPDAVRSSTQAATTASTSMVPVAEKVEGLKKVDPKAKLFTTTAKPNPIQPTEVPKTATGAKASNFATARLRTNGMLNGRDRANFVSKDHLPKGPAKKVAVKDRGQLGSPTTTKPELLKKLRSLVPQKLGQPVA